MQYEFAPLEGITGSVTYTHLTLPTNREVKISVVAGAVNRQKRSINTERTGRHDEVLDGDMS